MSNVTFTPRTTMVLPTVRSPMPLSFLFHTLLALFNALPLPILLGVTCGFAALILTIAFVSLCCQKKEEKPKQKYQSLPSNDESEEESLKFRPPASDASACGGTVSSPFDALAVNTSNVKPKTAQVFPQLPVGKPPHPPEGHGDPPWGGKSAPSSPTIAIVPPSTPPSLSAQFYGQDERVENPVLIVTFNYRAPGHKLFLFVHNAERLPSSARTGCDQVQVRMKLLPAKVQKLKTKWRSSEKETEIEKEKEKAEMEESFTLRGIPPEDVTNLGMRFRVYGRRKMPKVQEKLIGECILSFSTLNLDEETTEHLILEPRANLAALRTPTPHSLDSDRISLITPLRATPLSATPVSTTPLGATPLGATPLDATPRLVTPLGANRLTPTSPLQRQIQHGGGLPELQIALSYLENTGRVSLEVLRGTHFHNRGHTHPPDSYVRCSIVSRRGAELEKSKTSVRKGQPNPTFKEAFLFPVPCFQLEDVTMILSVFDKRGFRKKQLVGWCSLGRSSGSQEGKLHWKEMRETPGEVITRWHVLLETSMA